MIRRASAEERPAKDQEASAGPAAAGGWASAAAGLGASARLLYKLSGLAFGLILH